MSGEDAISTIERLEIACRKARQAIDYWRTRVNVPGLDANTSKAVGMMAQAYERIEYRLLEAIDLLKG